MSIIDAIKRAREIDEQATPMPWTARNECLCTEFEPDNYVAIGPDHEEGHDGECEDQSEMAAYDADFIATTRNAWKAAVDVIEAAAVYFGDDEAFFAGLNPTWFKQIQAVQAALAAFAEAMGEKQ